MRGLHKLRPVAVVPQQTVSVKDMKIAYAWELNLTEWQDLTDFERAECRRTVTTAPRFKATA